MKKYFLLLVFGMLWHASAMAQTLELSGEFRTRGEYKDLLRGSSFDPVGFVSQRSRLKLEYDNSDKHFRIGFWIQDARLWGNSDLFATGNTTSLDVYQAWIEFLLSEKWSLKIGRQEVTYDDERIMSINDFSNSGQSHDALILKYKGAFAVELGGAYNNSGSTGALYESPYKLRNYKTIQFVHFEKKWDAVQLGILFLNNGVNYAADPANAPNDLKTVYNQSTGFLATWKPTSSLKLLTTAHWQTGHDHNNRTLNAYNLKATAEYWFVPQKFAATLGADLFSGNPADLAADQNRSFTPLYGASLLHMGMAALYLLPFSATQNVYGRGVSKLHTELKYLHGKWFFWNRFFAYQSPNKIYNEQGASISRYLGVEEEFFAIYKPNDMITIQGIVGLFCFSKSLKSTTHPLLGSLANYKSWQRWYILEVTVRPQFLVHSWGK